MSQKNIEAIYPLSPMQEGMLFHTLSAPKSGGYFQQLCYTLHGAVDVSAFERAWQRVVDRHPVLRTLFTLKGRDKPLQVVRRQVKLPWEHQDWRGRSPNQQQEQLASFLQADRARGFELSRAPLMCVSLIRLAEDAYQFIWSFHNMLLDGWSGPLISEEVFAFYEAFRQGEDRHLKPPRPYRDYIAWLQQQDLSEAEMFWRQTLKGVTAPTTLKVAREKREAESRDDSGLSPEHRYDKGQIELSAATTAGLQSLAQAHRLTLNTLVQGAWAILLSRYSRENDVVFGATVSGRSVPLEGVENMVGLFINTLPVRVQVSPETSILPWLKAFQAQQVEMRQYEYSPLVEIQGWSEVPRGQPLFESIVVFENYPAKQKMDRSLELRNVRVFEQTNYPLTVVTGPGPQLPLHIIYDCSRFDAPTITRMLGHMRTLLEGIVANPEQQLSALPLLTETELHQLLVEWNKTLRDYPRDKYLHELFEVQAEQTPDAVSVVFEGDISYAVCCAGLL